MGGCMAASGFGIHFGEGEAGRALVSNPWAQQNRARLLAPLRFCGASLRWTAEGGRPYVSWTGRSPVTTQALALVPYSIHERPELS